MIDSYDRTLFAPGSPGCTSGPGAEVNLAENIEFNLHSIDGGKNGSLTGLNAGVAINPNNLPGQKVSGSCTPLWPHNFIRTNTIFGVLHKHGLQTAWSDKHPAYDIINGNKPNTQPVNGPGTNVDDFFAPEINSDLSQANINLIHSQLGLNFSTAPDPTPVSGDDFTGTIPGVEWYDGIKVRATLNEINRLDHTGTSPRGTPVLFGMNFQAVSVGQKLAGDGYLDPAATPSPGLLNAIKFVDTSIGQMISALDGRGLLGKTLIIVSAKHGQSPIDVTKRKMFSDSTVIAGQAEKLQLPSPRSMVLPGTPASASGCPAPCSLSPIRIPPTIRARRTSLALPKLVRFTPVDRKSPSMAASMKTTLTSPF